MDLGVGLVLFSGFEPALDTFSSLIDVIEIEPQTFWLAGEMGKAPRVDSGRLRHLAELPFPKLVHGVGFPVGGTKPPDPKQWGALRETLDALCPAWFSEHLSFNRTGSGEDEFQTAFLLPPRQTPEGVEFAVRSIRSVQRAIDVPVAIETGVNYLRPRSDEMADGEFFARVVEGSGCGILLDLHNLWANERNGRQSIEDFLAAIPLDQVWEMHLAGGMEHRGFWLDAHSGEMPDGLFDVAMRVAARLPNLRAVIYEMFPSYLQQIGFGVFRSQLEQLHRIWDSRGQQSGPRLQSSEDRHSCRDGEPGSTASMRAAEWEELLGRLVVGKSVEGAAAMEMASDPGIGIMQYVVNEFRGSVLARNLKFTCRMLMLHLGDAAFMALLHEFWRTFTPELFGSEEAKRFAEFMSAKETGIPGLPEVLKFEVAALETLLDNQHRTVTFSFDPMPVFRALAEGRVPSFWKDREVEIEITPDPPANTQWAGEYALKAIH